MDTTLKTLAALLTLAAVAPAQQDEISPFETMPMVPEVPQVAAAGVSVSAADVPALELYEIADITGQAAVESRRERLLLGGLGLDAEGLRQRLEELEQERQAAVRTGAELVEMIGTYLDPPYDRASGQLKAIGGSTLVVQGEAAQQEWVQRFLDEQRRFAGIITVRLQVFSAPFGSFAGLGYDAHEPARVLSAEQHEQLLAGMESAGVELVSSPSLSALPRQRASISIGDEQSFLVDWELRVVQPDGRKVADPVIETLQQGVAVELQVAPMADGSFGIAGRLRHSDILEPVETMEAVLDVGLPPVEFSLPTVNIFEAAMTLVMAPDSTALFVTSSAVRGEELALLLELQVQHAGDGR